MKPCVVPDRDILAPSGTSVVVPPLAALFVLPDARTLDRLWGSLAHLAGPRRAVFVAIESDPPGRQPVDRLTGRYPLLSVERLPTACDDEWAALRRVIRRRASSRTGRRRRPFLKALESLERTLPVPSAASEYLVRRRPAAVVVAPLPSGAHVDYLRAARALGIPSVLMAIDWRGVAGISFDPELPDCIALWNRAQRRAAIARGVPARRTCVIGASAQTDMLPDREAGDRGAYLASVGVAPTDRVVLLIPARAEANAAGAWVSDWLRAQAQALDDRVRNASVLAYVRLDGPCEDFTIPDSWIGVARTIVEQPESHFEAIQQLDQALAHADVVVAADVDGVVEALARARPVLAALGADVDLGRVCADMHASQGWPRPCHDTPEQFRALAEIFDRGCDQPALNRARAAVRVHGREVEPGFLLAKAVLRSLRHQPSPSEVRTAPGHLAHALAWMARSVRRVDRVEPMGARDRSVGRFLIILSSQSALPRWDRLIQQLIHRTHRVDVMFEDEEIRRTSEQAGVRSRISSVVATAKLALSALEPSPSDEVNRWRRHLRIVAFPSWAARLRARTALSPRLTRAARMIKKVDALLSPSRAAQRSIDSHAPDAVVAMPLTDPAEAVLSWVAQSDILRAARRRDIPTLICGASSTAVGHVLVRHTLAPDAIGSHADLLATAIEEWWRTTRGTVRPWRRRANIAASLLAAAAVTCGWAVVALRPSQVNPQSAPGVERRHKR